jgi:hypothetical protein
MVIDSDQAIGHAGVVTAASREELRRSLVEIDIATRENVTRSLEIQSRVEWIKKAIDDDVPIQDILGVEPKPVVVELVSQNIEALQTIGSRLRQAQARALRAEGVTMAAIGNMFGVTRQRISALLRQGSGP